MITATILQFAISGIVIGLIYGLAAIAYSTIYNVTGVINFAQGDMVTLPTLSGIAVAQAGFGYAGAVAASLATGALLGALLDWGVIAHLRGSVLRSTIATVGVGIVLQGIAILVFGTDAQTLDGPWSDRTFIVAGASITGASATAFLVAAALVGALGLLFQATVVGRAFRACSLNPFAARLSGIDVGAMRRLAFVLSGVVASVIGIIVTPITLMEYDTGSVIGISGFVACIIGGLGSPAGALAGGLLLGMTESFSTWLFGSGYKSAISLALMIAFLLLRPDGLAGLVKRGEA